MEGYPQVTQLYAQALDSAGTAQQKFQAYQEGTTAKLDKLKASWEAVWMSAFQSNTIQNIISGFTSVANGVQKVTSTLGDLPVIVGTATTAFFLFNNKMKETIMLNGQLVTKAFAALIPQFRTLENSLVASQSRLAIWGRGWNTAVGMVKTSLSSLKAVAASTFTFLAGAAVPLVIFTGISLVIQKLTDNYQKAQQSEKELQQQSDKLVSSYKNHKDEINKLVKQYEDLSTIRSNSKLDNDQEKQYTDIQNQLAKLLPSISAGENAKSDAVLKSSDAIKDQIKLLDQAIKLQKEKNTLDAPKNIMDNANSINKTSSMGSQTGGLQQQLDYSKRISDSYEKDLKNAKEEKLTSSEIVEIRRELQNELVKQNGIQQQINSKNQSNASSIKSYFSGMKIDSSALTQVAFDLTSISLKGKSLGDIDGMFKGISKSVNDLNKALKDNDKKAIKDAENSLESYGIKGKLLQKIISDLVNALNQKSDASKKDSKTNKDESFSVEELSKKLSDAKGSFTNTKNAIMDMIKSKQLDMAITASQTQLYSEMSDKLSPVNQALENLANGQSLTASSAMDLIKKVPEMTKYLSIQNGQVKVNVQGIIDWRDAQVAAFQDAIKAEKAQIDAQSSGLKTKLKNYGVEIQAILSVADANKALAEAQDQYNKKVNDMNNSPDAMHASMIGGQKTLDNQYKSLTDGINSIKDAYNNLDQLSGMASTGLTQVGTSMDKTSSSTEKSTYVVDKYKNSIDALNAALEHLKSIQQDYPKYSQEYRNALEQENKLIQQQIDLTKAQASNLKQQIDSGLIQQTGMITKSNSNGSVSSGSGSGAVTGSYTGQYASYINQAAAQYGVDPNLVAAIIKQESGFTQTRNGRTLSSSAGALGLMQLMPGTANSLGVNPNDAYQNILGGTKYISQLLSQFGGDIQKAVAGYNWGPAHSAIRNWNVSAMPKETQNYIKAVMANYSNYSGGATPNLQASGTLGTTGKTAANMQQDIDQAKSQLLQYYQTIDQLTNDLKSNNLEIVNTYIAQFDHIKSQIDSQIAQYDYLQNIQDKNSTAWMQTQMNRESAYQKQIKTEQESIDFIKQQIVYNNQLTQAQKDTLSDDVLQRQQEVLSIEQKLYDTRSQMADEIVSTYKTALQDMKDATTKSIDNMINEINKQADQADYKKKLADAQKSAQQIQDEINKLMLDDSTAAKKRIADLQKQLSDQNNSISQMISDNNKQQQIDNLNAQKDSISTYYDNMLNDEDKFAQMRSNILNINNQSIIDSLNSLSTQVKANVNLLGTSVVNTLIDAINRANGYMGLSTQNAGAIGHIASLSVGGITPNWSGSSGKLAVLHQDEMISNKVDTSNFLKSINLVKDMVTNLFKPTNLSGVLSPATAGGNTYQVYFQVDKMTGNQSDVNNFITKFVNGVKAKGGVI